MLIFPVVIPMEENLFFRRTIGNSDFGPHQILPASIRIVTMAISVFKKVKFQEPEDSSDESDEEHVTSSCDKRPCW